MQSFCQWDWSMNRRIPQGEIPRAPFLVVVHDVCPVFESEVSAIVTALKPLIGRNMAAAVVPNWHGRDDINDRFHHSLNDHFDELLLHGWTHRREQGSGAVSFVTQGSDEFSGLSVADARHRLKLGQQKLGSLLGGPIAGFVPPAWQRGPIRPALLKETGLQYLMGYRTIEWSDGFSMCLSTFTWDVGRFAVLGLSAEWIGRLMQFSSPNRLTCLAVHPVDVPRGYLPRIVSIVDSLLAAGRTPCLPGELHSVLAKETAA
jgi:predicted deacetylase